MNRNLILFSGFMTMAVGAGLGFVLATLFQTPFRTGLYRDQKPGFVIVGGVGGFLFGCSIEVLRELKARQDEEEDSSQK